jgi:large subunit ribosomal protein L7/L12
MADKSTENTKQKTENEKAEPSVAEAMKGKEKKEESKGEEKKTEAKPVEPKKEEKPKTEPKPKAVKLSKKLQDLMGEIEKLSLLELADLVKALEEKFGAAPMVAPAVSGAPTGAPSEAGEAAGAGEQTTFNVVLASAGANKISVIKAVREINQTLGLKDAKDLVESCPKEILSAVNKTTAEEAKKKLESAGATVELK